MYYYIRNLQGDIIGIIDKDGNLVVEYEYDAWGKLLSTTGALASTIGVENPFRYRGYYYDTETGLYSLQSRYYDPITCRFINADDTSILGVEQGSLIQYNLFAYCLNNPVNMTDDGGYCAANIIGGIIGGVSGAILGVLIADAMGLKGWKRYALIAGATVAGVALGAFLGPYVARLSSAVAAKIASAATVAGATASKMSASAAAKIISTAQRVGTALTKSDIYHRSASWLTKSQLAKGKVFDIIGNDGVKRTLLQVNGELNGKKGIFEYIINEAGYVSHQLFKVGGVINGKPN